MADAGHHAGVPPRLGHVFQSYDPPLYFVTANAWKRTPWLGSSEMHQAFCAYGRQNLDAGRAIGGYVMMPDHVHFFVRLSREDRLSDFVRLLKQALTKAFRCSGGSASHSESVHRANATPERLWQPGFFDHLLRSTESYAEKWRYVRENPVRAGLARTVEEWPYQGEIARIDRA